MSQNSPWTCAPSSKLGVLMVGLGGNNGSTFHAALQAHQLDLQWEDDRGVRRSGREWLGSVAMSGSLPLEMGRHVPVRTLVDFADLDAMVVGGWDISRAALDEAIVRAGVLSGPMRRELRRKADLSARPWPSLYYPRFIAGNQRDRANNTLAGETACAEHLDRLRCDIRGFKRKHGIERVVVVWMANTERMAKEGGLFRRDPTALLAAIAAGNEPEIPPSLMFGVAAVLEGCVFFNGSPQNTLCPALAALARQKGTLVGGNDLKTGQTKLKGALADLLVGSAFELESVVSYNHLGNNDGKNLSEEAQFRSKELSKSGLLDHIVATNPALAEGTRRPYHLVRIEYAPPAGDNKQAIDEWVARIFHDARLRLTTQATCPDSMLAVPIILDLILFGDWLARLRDTQSGSAPGPVASALALFFKDPQGDCPEHSYYLQREALFGVVRDVTHQRPFVPRARL